MSKIGRVVHDTVIGPGKVVQCKLFDHRFHTTDRRELDTFLHVRCTATCEPAEGDTIHVKE